MAYSQKFLSGGESEKGASSSDGGGVGTAGRLTRDVDAGCTRRGPEDEGCQPSPARASCAILARLLLLAIGLLVRWLLRVN